jgi:hypothetical protein
VNEVSQKHHKQGSTSVGMDRPASTNALFFMTQERDQSSATFHKFCAILLGIELLPPESLSLRWFKRSIAAALRLDI